MQRPRPAPTRRATAPGLCSAALVALVAVAALAALAAGPATARADDVPAAPEEPRPNRGAFYYPRGPDEGELRGVVGLSLDVLPRRLVEAEQRIVPRVTGGVRGGLPHGLWLDARVSAIVLSNEILAGVGWSYATPDFALELHERLGLWFGAIGVEGFDATGVGLVNAPGMSFGVAAGEVRFTLGATAILSHTQTFRVGGLTLRRNRLTFEGLELPLTVESMWPWGGAMYAGLTMVWARPDYQLWLVFSDGETRQLYPRFVLGYEI
ncbi:MAG: hypothetical protein HY908_36955 [Myxococcales bacterium]|nr:hypothetical protein [Myxococcales bacterium]